MAVDTLAAAPKLPELPTVPLSLVEEALKELQNLQKYRAEHHKKHHQKQERRPVNIEIERYFAEADDMWHNALARGRECWRHL